MTFQEFQATRKYTDCLADVNQDGCYEDIGGYVYADSFYIEQYKEADLVIADQINDDFVVSIGSCQNSFGDDLAAAEKHLWDNFAKDEITAGDLPYHMTTED